jgi:serine/threonine-protein kinase
MSGSDRTLPITLGRYKLFDKIGAGGMATVHLGRLVGPVGFARTVAIKRMRSDAVTDPEFVSMFLDEARLAARIHHPNVVPTLDVVSAAGELFIVMEYVRGESLARLLQASKLADERVPVDVAVTLMVGVLHGLHAAHEAKDERGELLELVHRDVSPHNILVGLDGVPRLLDFGIAKAVGRAQTTQNGQLKGKLSYMAPEQLTGGRVTRQTDVFAASIVLWETLAGCRLFQGDNEGQSVERVLSGRVVPPSRHADLPPALDAVVLRGLSVEPADRYPTARDMALALEEALPLAAPSKIGRWVEALAKETLRWHDERVAEIQSGVDDDETAAGMTQRQVLSDSPAASGGSPGRAASFERRPVLRQAWPLAIAIGLVAILLVVFESRQSPKPPLSERPGAGATPAPTAAPSVAPAAAAADSARPDTSLAVNDAPAPRPSPPPRAARAPAPPPGPASARSSGVASAAPSATSAPACDPPWFFDERGLRIFKKECL